MLEVEFEKLQKVHEETERLINETENISGTLLSEYRRGVEQYKSMYSSMELFKKDCSSNSMSNFVNQQEVILKNWTEFELNLQNKLKGLN